MTHLNPELVEEMLRAHNEVTIIDTPLMNHVQWLVEGMKEEEAIKFAYTIGLPYKIEDRIIDGYHCDMPIDITRNPIRLAFSIEDGKVLHVDFK